MVNDNSVFFNQKEIRLLKRLGLNNNDIKFIEAYSSNEDIAELLNKAEEKDKYISTVKTQIQENRKNVNNRRRNRKAQAKYALGGYLLSYCIEKGIIDDEESILTDNSNNINDSFKYLVNKMTDAIDSCCQ